MSWKEKIKELGAASVIFLSTDGAAVEFIVVGDPEQVTSRYGKTEQIRLAAPVFNEEGLQEFVMNKRTARKMSSVEDRFDTEIVRVTRHGAENDTNTTYEVITAKDSARVKSLKKAFAEINYDEAWAEVMGEVREVLKQ